MADEDNIEQQTHWPIIQTTMHSSVNCIMFLDQRKTFDSVDFSILQNLKPHGFWRLSREMNRKLHNSRMQRVIINDHNFAWMPSTTGVLKWSLLVPFLFLMYINDICQVVEKWQVCCDDTSVLGSTSSRLSFPSDLCKKL